MERFTLRQKGSAMTNAHFSDSTLFKSHFTGDSLSGYLDGMRDAAIAAIEDVGNEELLASDTKSLAERLVERYSVRPLTFGEIKYSKPRELKDHNHVEIRQTFSFQGDKKLFDFAPSTSSLNMPHGTVRDTEVITVSLIIDIREFDEAPSMNEFREIFERNLQKIKAQAEYANQDVRLYNDSLINYLLPHIEKRKKRVENIESASM